MHCCFLWFADLPGVLNGLLGTNTGPSLSPGLGREDPDYWGAAAPSLPPTIGPTPIPPCLHPEDLGVLCPLQRPQITATAALGIRSKRGGSWTRSPSSTQHPGPAQPALGNQLGAPTRIGGLGLLQP